MKLVGIVLLKLKQTSTLAYYYLGMLLISDSCQYIFTRRKYFVVIFFSSALLLLNNIFRFKRADEREWNGWFRPTQRNLTGLRPRLGFRCRAPGSLGVGGRLSDLLRPENRLRRHPCTK